MRVLFFLRTNESQSALVLAQSPWSSPPFPCVGILPFLQSSENRCKIVLRLRFDWKPGLPVHYKMHIIDVCRKTICRGLLPPPQINLNHITIKPSPQVGDKATFILTTYPLLKPLPPLPKTKSRSYQRYARNFPVSITPIPE